MLLSPLFSRLMTIGRLDVVDAAGRRHSFAGSPGPAVTIRLRDPKLYWKLLLRPRLRFPEALVDGTMTVEDGTLYDLMDLLARNLEALPRGPLAWFLDGSRGVLRRVHQYNPLVQARKNAAHHYDLSGEFYELFLDSDRQYSCAYFRHGGSGLDAAQYDKKEHIAAKLLLRPGLRVLDIGSGWGGLALHLAREYDARVTGLTLSAEQLKMARQRAAAAGLGERVEFHLRDYREERGEYDRIVSVGMFEHVGVNHYRAFFAQLRALLAPDGVALLHSIGRMDGPGSTSPWIRKYIFPGGYVPALSEVLPVVERLRLWVTDIEILRLHYAETLRLWRQRFMTQRDRVRAIYDERFCRMWEMYLVAAEMAFRCGGHLVFQMQLARRIDAVPLVRDYIVDGERGRRATTGRAA